MNKESTPPKAFSVEPYASLVKGGPVFLHEVSHVVGRSQNDIDVLIEFGFFPCMKCVDGLPPFYNRKKIVAFRWAIEQHPVWKEAIEIFIGKRSDSI